MPTRLLLPQDAIRDFCRAHAVRELAVFGSAVRVDFGSDSDVDVLIDLAPDARVGLDELIQSAVCPCRNIYH
ncbi:MAG: nucleotidyltransferase domain-containing protein [Sulfuritalea sp.]|nr:nucleotidyltransferase domain-containing protein [Sulfuritalea sp.]